LPLHVRGVRKRFGGLSAVDRVTFEVQPGEAFGVIGPNGAGKTTLLNCISGVLHIDAGEIMFGSRRIDGLRPNKLVALGMARTFQLAEHFTSFKAYEFVMLGRLRHQRRGILASALGLPAVRASERREQDNARGRLRDVGLGDICDERLSDLAYGVQKRVDLVRALAAEPKILLLDEPTSGVSPQERIGIRDSLEVAAALGITRIIVDHDVSFVTETCARALVMHYGQELALGTPAQVFQIPAVREAYLGS
jgi:branched-chain amino acid transport system ATP-binding protein